MFENKLKSEALALNKKEKQLVVTWLHPHEHSDKVDYFTDIVTVKYDDMLDFDKDYTDGEITWLIKTELERRFQSKVIIINWWE